MSVPSNKLPAQLSPLAKDGSSLDTRTLTCAGGILTNIDEYLRPSNKAAKIRNFHQFTRGVFSSSGGGWVRDVAAGLNGGAVTLGFGEYVDALGNRYLLAQAGSVVYSYAVNTSGGAGGSGTSLKTGLSATALPCMRPAAPTPYTTNPFTVYCNGVIEPRKFYNTASGAAPNTDAALGFINGLNVETFTIGGSIVAADSVSLTFTSSALVNSPVTVSYAVIAGDTTTTIATALAKLINTQLATFGVGGVSASSVANVITLSYPTGIAVTFGQSVKAASTEAITIASSGGLSVGDVYTVKFQSAFLSPTIVVLSYTVAAGDTTTAVAAKISNLINQTAALTALSGLSATSSTNVITVTFPFYAAITFSGSTSTVNDQITFGALGGGGAGSATVALADGSTSVWPGTFNGLTYTKPALCSPFGSRFAYTAFANTGASGQAVGNVVLISGLGSAESFPLSTPTRATDAWSVPIPPILGTPTAMTSFRPLTNIASEVLVIGCQNGMAIISGTDATNFNLQIQSTQYGIPSNSTFVQLDNKLVHLATDGFRTYDGTNSISTLITDTLSLDFYDQFLRIDRTAWAKSHAVHHRDTQEVWFWVPYNGDDGIPAHGDNGNPQHAFILNYNTMDGNPIWYSKDNTTCTASIEFNRTFYGGNDVGIIQKWYGVNNYDDASTTAGAGSAANILPGAEIVLSLASVGNPTQFCSINKVVVGTSSKDQKFLINAAAAELMDNGATRKQQQQPINFLLTSISAPQTVLGAASPNQWTLNSSAFPSQYPKFLDSYVPFGHGRCWEFSLSCHDSDHNLDFTFLTATISIGGQRI